MADALVSPTVAAVAGATSIVLIVAASKKVANNPREGLTSLMGVLGAFVFAAQMINFTIPGTGSSGHIVGGVLLSSLLGPWAAFLTLSSVIIVQCLVFADGGLMALGCNIVNMAAVACLVAYPLIFHPICNARNINAKRLTTASIAACTVALVLGAALVSVETVASGVTSLSLGAFLSVMLPIHLVIGACEGVATALVLCFVYKNSPAMLTAAASETPAAHKRRRQTLVGFAVVAAAFAVSFTWIASSHPDGLEWSLGKLLGGTALPESSTPFTAIMPDYDSYLAGILGAVIVMCMLWALSTVLFRSLRKAKKTTP